MNNSCDSVENSFTRKYCVINVQLDIYARVIQLLSYIPYILITYDQHDGSGDHAKNNNVVDGHPNQSRVVNLLQLHRPGFVCEEKTEY